MTSSGRIDNFSARPRPTNQLWSVGALDLANEDGKMTMKRARWGASHVIHEQFSDGFPELADRYVGERQAAERRYEYNLGCRRFDDVMRAEAGITMLKRLFRTLDQAVAVDMTLAQVRLPKMHAHHSCRQGALQKSMLARIRLRVRAWIPVYARSLAGRSAGDHRTLTKSCAHNSQNCVIATCTDLTSARNPTHAPRMPTDNSR